MPLDFTAVDFETANSFKGSACAVAATKVRRGRVVAEECWLINPPAPHNSFDDRNVEIHGITAADVAGAADFGAVLAQLCRFVGEDVVAAHHAVFDAAVVRAASAASGVTAPPWLYSCTLALARKTYRAPSYSLPFVADAANVKLVHHHNPVEDARACAGILCDVAQRHSAHSVQQLHEQLGLPLQSHAIRQSPEDDWLRWPTDSPDADPHIAEGLNPPASTVANPQHPLCGQTVVISGRLALSRQQAKRWAAQCGALTADTVGPKTSVLVVGEGIVAEDLRAGEFFTSTLSAKVKRALDLLRGGAELRILSEQEFLGLLAA